MPTACDYESGYRIEYFRGTGHVTGMSGAGLRGGAVAAATMVPGSGLCRRVSGALGHVCSLHP